jgi:hypothetical protein
MRLRRLTIATFNLYNLNLPGLPMYRDREGWSQDEYDRKIVWIARMLDGLDADVIGVQELWHPDALQAALDASRLKDTHELLAPPGAAGARIVCAALVRKGLRVEDPEWLVSFPEGFRLQSRGEDPQTPAISVDIADFSRPVMRFRIKPRDDRDDVFVYVCHFKSKGPTPIYIEDWYVREVYSKHAQSLGAALSTIRRTAEAAALRFLLSEQMKDSRVPVIVLGDINDGQHSNTANILTEQPRYLVGESKGGGDTALYTAQTLQEYRSTRDVYYTHVHQDIMESLDHILVSEEFYDNSRRRIWIFDGMVVANDHLNREDHKLDGSTDHGVIAAAFEYRPIRAEAEAIAAAPPA